MQYVFPLGRLLSEGGCWSPPQTFDELNQILTFWRANQDNHLQTCCCRMDQRCSTVQQELGK